MKDTSVKKILFTFFKLCLGVTAIFLILRKVDLNEVYEISKEVNVSLLLCAFLSFFVSKIFAAFRLNTYYKTQGITISNQLSIKLNLYGMFYNLFIPLAGGEGFKILWIKKRFEVKTKQLILVSLLDRISGLIALLCLALLFFPFTSIDLPFKWLVLLVIPVMYGTYLLVHHQFFKSFKVAWIKVNMFSFVVQALQVLTSYLILMALGVEEQVLNYLFIFLLSCMAYVMPFVGARELAFVYGATYFGLDEELSLTISLFFYLSLSVTSFLGIYFLLFPKELR